MKCCVTLPVAKATFLFYPGKNISVKIVKYQMSAAIKSRELVPHVHIKFFIDKIFQNFKMRIHNDVKNNNMTWHYSFHYFYQPQ